MTVRDGVEPFVRPSSIRRKMLVCTKCGGDSRPCQFTQSKDGHRRWMTIPYRRYCEACDIVFEVPIEMYARSKRTRGESEF